MIFKLFFQKNERLKTRRMAMANFNHVLDSLSDQSLKDWLEGMSRLQKEFVGRHNARARIILNSTASLNRWLDAKTRDDIFERVWELQVKLTKGRLQKKKNVKGPVSGFVGHIPLPLLESRINGNH